MNTHTRFTTSLAGLAACSALVLGAGAPTQAAPAQAPAEQVAAAAPSQPAATASPFSVDAAAGKLVPIRQANSQVSTWYDCGPVSLLMSLFDRGVTPEKWSGDPADPTEAVRDMRATMGAAPTGNTNVQQVRNGFAAYGFDTHWVATADEAEAAAREGKTVMVLGDAQVAGKYWQEDLATSESVSHWVVLAGYDKDSGKYTVLDPLSGPDANEPHSVGADWTNQFHDVYGYGAVVVD